MLSILMFCRPHIRFPQANILSLKMSPMPLPPVQAFQSRDIASGIEALLSPKIFWAVGLDQALSDRQGIALEILSQFLTGRDPILQLPSGAMLFKPKISFNTEHAFQRSSIALGRAIALAIRYWNNLFNILSFDPIILKAVYEHMEADILLENSPSLWEYGIARDSPNRGELVRQFVHEPAFFIRIGFQDVLGPLGLKVYDEELLAQFFVKGGNPNPSLF